jgi:penicillin-binding protein-related factor A (putative recombinase)
VKNTGKKSEHLFDEAFARLGKRAFVFAFTDASEARGVNKKHVTIKAQPSDRVVTLDGETFYAEIKSTTHPTRFDFSLLRTSQGSFARMIEAAGGTYKVFIHSLTSNEWFVVPYKMIRATKLAGTSSFQFSELESHRCTLI